MPTQQRNLLILFLGITPLCLLLLAYLPVYTKPGALLVYLLKTAFSNICHQKPEKCAGEGLQQALLCMRCSGIYAGAVLGVFAARVAQLPVNRYVTIAACLPLICDVLCYNLGVYSYSFFLAFCTGGLAGGVLLMYTGRAIYLHNYQVI